MLKLMRIKAHLRVKMVKMMMLMKYLRDMREEKELKGMLDLEVEGVERQLKE